MSTTVDVVSNTDLRVELAVDHVATVEIRRGPNNYLDTALIEALGDELMELAAASCRAVVLCSESRHFCAGARLEPGPADTEKGPHLYDVAIRLFEQPLPIVAAVQGAAIGGGLGLALAADFRIASQDARFSLSRASRMAGPTTPACNTSRSKPAALLMPLLLAQWALIRSAAWPR